MKKFSSLIKSGLQSRNRGISLIEGVLYLGIASSVVVLSAQMMAEENRRQEDITTASQLNLFLAASQSYVATEYDSIREQLLAQSSSSGSAEISVDMSTLATAGYLPQSYSVNTTNVFGQDYALLMRAVSVQDTATPASTMTTLQMDANADGQIDSHLLDRDNTNNEMTIESILVSHGGEEVPTTRGAPISVRSERPTAGFIEVANSARGAYGAFEFDISGFNSFPEYPGIGHFASIVSLARFLSLDLIEGDSSSVVGIDDPLRRCQHILTDPGNTVASPLYAQCLATGRMYSEVVFNTYDIDGDGVDDTFPGITGLTDLNMSGAQDTDSNGRPDRFASINNVYDMNFGTPADTNGDAIADKFGRIDNLYEIECGNGTSSSLAVNTLVLDCATTSVTGNLQAGGNVTSAGDIEAQGDLISNSDITASGEVTGGRFISSEMGNQDYSEGIYQAFLLASGDTVQKPVCPTTTADGLFSMEPRIYVFPAAYSHPAGLPTVGVRAYAREINATTWEVRLFNFVDEDRCTSSVNGVPGVNGPLKLISNNLNADNPGQCDPGDEDAKADVYEIPGNIGRVFTVTRCY
jgi:hypothetical protein